MGKNQHVVPSGGDWGVRGEGNSTQRYAIEAGRVISQNQKSELVIHGRDGKIHDKDSFGKDPCPPKDRRH